MRYVLGFVLLCFGAASAQIGDPALSQDPVFANVLARRIMYPPAGRTYSVYGRFYASFDVDEQGRVQNIQILSPINDRYGFEQAVRAGLRKLPHLSVKYAGQYALPVAFVYTNYNESPNPHRPTNTVSASALGGRTVLKEITVAAESYSDTRRLVQVPPSRQVGPYIGTANRN